MKKIKYLIITLFLLSATKHLYATDTVQGKVRVKILAAGVAISLTYPDDGVAYFGEQVVNTSTCSYGIARRIEVKNVGSVNVTYSVKTDSATKTDGSPGYMYPGTSAAEDIFVIYAVFYKWDQAPNLDNYGTNDILGFNYITASNTQGGALVASDAPTIDQDPEYYGYNVPPDAQRNLKFRLDTPTSLSDSNGYAVEQDIPIIIKAQAQ